MHKLICLSAPDRALSREWMLKRGYLELPRQKYKIGNMAVQIHHQKIANTEPQIYTKLNAIVDPRNVILSYVVKAWDRYLELGHQQHIHTYTLFFVQSKSK